MENEIIKDIEICLLEQFIEILQDIEKKKKVKEIKDEIEVVQKRLKKEVEYIAEKDNLFELEQIDKTLDEKIEKYSQMYCNTPTYIMLEKEAKMLKPLIYGGTGLDSKNKDMPEQIPVKLEAGSANIQSIAGLNAALKWIKKIGIEKIRAKEKVITQKVLEVIKEHSNISIIRGENEEKNIGVISCVFDGYSSDSIGQVLSDKNIAVRTGLHCAPLGHELLKTAPDGTVRISVNYFTSDEDIQALNEALDYIELER